MLSACRPEPGFPPKLPNNALPQLPPKAELETKLVMKALVGARAALAELKQAGELIPNQSILINTLPVLEAPARRSRTSSPPPTRLFRFAQQDESGQADPETKEALRYQSALKDLCDIGVLREVKAGREKLFIHPNLMKLLTAEDHKVPGYRVCVRNPIPTPASGGGDSKEGPRGRGGPFIFAALAFFARFFVPFDLFVTFVVTG